MAFIRAKCWASQKKSTRYEQSLILRKTADTREAWEVDWATCAGCPAGTDGGLCHHVFAVLEVIQYCGPKADDSSHLPAPISVTSQKCTWGPRERCVDPQPTMQTVVERAKLENERKKKAIGCSFFEARGENLRLTTQDRVENVR